MSSTRFLACVVLVLFCLPYSPLLSTESELLQTGLDLARQGRLDEALSRFTLYAQRVPADPEGHFQAGRTLLAMARRDGTSYEQAIRSLEKAHQLAPDQLPVTVQLAEALGARKPGTFSPDRALALYEGILETHPDRTDVRMSLVRWLFDEEVRLTRWGSSSRVVQDSAWTMDLAQFQLEKAIDRVVPSSREALDARLLQAEVFFRMGDWETARSLYTSLVDEISRQGLNPGLAWHSIGHTWLRQDRPVEAAEAFRKAVEIVPHPYYRYALRVALEAAGVSADSVPPSMRFPLRSEAIDAASPPFLKFTDVAADLHVAKYAGAGPAGWADYDNDGDQDLVVCGCDAFCTLYEEDAGTFSDATLDAGLGRLEPGFATAWADYDNDGDSDLYIARNGWNGTAPNSLLRNNGDGTFTDVAEQAGVADDGSGFHAAWFDYDRDGRLDLLVSNGVYLDGSTNQLYRNRGDGTFANVTVQARLYGNGRYGTIGVAIGDYDDDAWLDIFFHGRGEPNRLYRNKGDGTFEEVAARAGVAGSSNDNGYIALFSDLDSDGDLDLFTGSLASWPDVLAGYQPGFEYRGQPDIPRFYRNNGDGTFRDDSLETGLFYPLGIMAAGIADLDNDGYLDIYLGTGNPEVRRLEPNILYHNQGGATFQDVTRYAGLGALGKGHGITFIDWDHDGDLEIFAELGGFYHGDRWDSAFYRNDAGNRNHWLGIRLRQPGPNRDAIGARVTVRAGDRAQVQEVTAGRGFGSTDPLSLHFGLGGEESADRVEVRWPGGLMEEVRDVGAGQILVMEAPGAIESPQQEEDRIMPLSIISPAFTHEGEIPGVYTCEGRDISPALQWMGTPVGTKTFVLIVDDPDAPDPKAPKMTWVHWILYNLPASSPGLDMGVKTADLPGGTREGINDWKRTGYGGPCPPIGRHRYYHKLYALDAELPDLKTPTRGQVEEAMKGHILGEAVLMGTYEKEK